MQKYLGKIVVLAMVGTCSASLFSITDSASAILAMDPPPDSTLISPAESTAQEEKPKLYDDRRGDPINNPEPNSPFVIKPSNIEPAITLSPDLSGYEIKEGIGDSLQNRPPTSMSPEDYAEYRRQQLMREHWKKVSKTKVDEQREAEENFTGWKVGNKKDPLVDIVPAGNVTITLGGRWQKTENPAVPVNLQRTGGFDFDQQIQLNLLGTIGDRLKVNANWNTKATFDFDNNLKIAYQAKPEDWLRDIQAGNIQVPLNTQLIRGAQKLFGVKTVMQFGKVGVTSFFSSQQGASETLLIRGGGQGREFEFAVAEYDNYKHFYLGHYFRDIFEQAYKNNPTNPNNGFKINRVEAYITNSNANTQNLKSIVAFTDLGEARDINLQNPAQINPLVDTNAIKYISNDINNLSELIKKDSVFRNSDNTINYFTSNGLVLGADFEKINNARALEEGRDFTFHPELGFISLNSKLQDDEALAVSFEYTLNGINYRVGELKEDYQSFNQKDVIVLKLLKPARVDLNLQTWDLMMKNIYSLNTSQVDKENFQLRIIYRDDFSGIDNPSIQEGKKAKGIPLLQLFGLDKLNPNGDLMPDGNFDFIEEATVLTKKGQLIFPTPEPFGEYMNRADVPNGLQNSFFADEEGGLKSKYVFKALYNNTQAQARRETLYNKFFIKGRYQSASSASIILPGLNITEGSVSIRAGSIPLREGTDYTVDYAFGRVNILNTGVMASGKDIEIKYEKADLFRFRTKSLIGTRVEYNHSKVFHFGTTFMRMAEAPLVTRISVGDEPLNNTQLGADFGFAKDSRVITKLVDALPVIQTKAISSVSANWEAAMLLPGNSKVLGENGTSYIDDFEGAETPYDFSKSINQWVISTPPVFLGDDFNEYADTKKTDPSIGDHRGKLVWFNPDLSFYRGSLGAVKGVGDGDFHAKNQFTRGISIQEIFPGKDLVNNVNNAITTFDINYYPRERGQYNYNANPSEIDPATGYFKNPEKNWAGITRSITFDTDFENANIEFIEFWMMDPFNADIYKTFPEELQGVDPRELGGDLYFNLGDISEDLIKDHKHGFENGLPDNVDSTKFGFVTNETFLTNAFDNRTDRNKQDIGFDGISDDSERKPDFFGNYISLLQSFVDPNAAGYQNFVNDPSSDNFEHYITNSDENASTADQRTIVERYKYYNGYESNSPINSVKSSGTTPDNEDLNNNKTLDEVNRYFQYHLPFNQDVFDGTTNHPYIVNEKDTMGTRYYQVRIPIKAAQAAVGGISNFNTIKYFRMYLTGFKHPIAIRMINFQLVASQWRKYTGNDLQDGSLTSDSRSDVDPYPNVYLSTVNIEENNNYQIPPGVVRDRNQTSINSARQNEQSLQICAEDIKYGDGAAAFKNITTDLINYKRIKMFIHGETSDQSTKDNELYAFLRLGTDITQNYYEIAVPLKFSTNSQDPNEIWKAENEIDIAIQDLTDLKLERNQKGVDFRKKYTKIVGKYKISIVGSPDRSTIRSSMVGIENPKENRDYKSACVWFNELRVTDFDKKMGWATIGNVNVQLADLGSISGSMRYTSANYGDIESKFANRSREQNLSYGAQTNLQLHKFGADKIGLQLPFFASIDNELIKPKYDPFDPDVKLSEQQKSDEYLSAVTYNRSIKSINLTNVKKNKMNAEAKKHFYDVENLTVSAGYKEETRQGSQKGSSYGNAIASYLDQNYQGSANYAYNFKPINITPFKKSKVKSKYFDIVKDFNLSPIPSSLSIQGTLNRRYFTSQLYNGDFRAVGGGNPSTTGVTPNYEKSFTFARNYNLRWNLTKALNMSYTANANALIDEPFGDKNGENGMSKSQYNQILWGNISKLGRLKNFDQKVNLSYKIPIDKIPVFNWITADAKYDFTYKWHASAYQTDLSKNGTYAAPQLMKDANGEEIGNFIGNTRDFTVNTKLNLTRFYTKSNYLKDILAYKSKTPIKPAPKSPTDTLKEKVKTPSNFHGHEHIIRALLMVQNITLKYSINENTDLPGFLSNPQALGLNFDGSNSMFAPGYAFLTGSQNLTLIKNDAIGNGWYTKSLLINTPLQQTSKQTISAKASLEPFKDFRVQLDADYSQTEGYQEIVRYNPNGSYDILNPTYGGNVKYSYIALPTSFVKDGLDNNNRYFQNLKDSRDAYLSKLNSQTPGEGSYTKNSADVLIPAFIAAYTGKQITSADQLGNKDLRKTPKVPLPNWKIDYAGLGRIKAFRKYFSSISISHGYESDYEIRSFKSSLEYTDINYQTNLNSTTAALDTNNSGNYIPLLIVNEVVISEKFTPLIGFNVRTKGGMSFRFNYNKSRNLALDLSNYQVTEMKNNDFDFGFGWTTKKSPIKKWKGEPVKLLPNDLTYKMDVTVRDQKTVQRLLDGNQEITAGNINFQLRPNISYQYNKKLNIQAYFERTINQPAISSSYRRNTTAFGVRVRFSLT